MANEYSINAKITADSSDFQKAVKDASKSLEGMKDAFSKATQNIKKSCADWGLDIDRFYNKGSKIFKDFGIDIDKFAAHFGTTGKVVAAITTASIALTKFGQSMNEARAEIAKGTGAVGEDLIKLQDTLHKAMIEGIGRDAKEVGGMMADLNTRFGATEKELVDMTDQFDKFSAVMGVDSRQAINDTADVMARWGIETKNLNPLLDQLTTASQMSGASINELTSGLIQGQSVFSQFGMSATDSIAILSSLAKNGIETNTAITALKYSLNVFSKVGVDAKTGLNETIEAITNAKTETEALSVACEVFGARNGVDMVKVLKSGSMSADEFKTALMNAGGALSSVARASRTSVDAIADLKSVLAGTFAGFGEGFDNIFKDLLDSIKDVIQFVAPAIEPIGNIFRDVATAIGEMLRVLVENFIEFEKRYNVVFKAVVNVLKTAYEIIHKVLGNILESFKTSFSLIFAILDGKWGLAWENAKKLALLFAKSLADILSGIVELFSKMMNGIIEKINSAIDLYHKLPKAVQIFEIGNLDKISEKVDFASKWKITEKLKEVQQEIDKLSGKTAEKVIGDLGKVKTVTEEVADSIKGQSMEVAQFNQDLASNQKGFFDTWTKQYEDLAGNWEKTFVDMANAGTQAMGDMFTQIGEGLVNGGNGFEEYSAIAVESIANVLKSLSAQLSAEAAVAAAHYDYATAAMAAAGAAAALVAAGTLAATAKQMKSVSDAAKDATLSVDAFIKKLNELWSGTVTTSAFVTSMSQTRKLLTETNEELDKARYKFDSLYNSLSAKGKEYFKNDWYYDFTHTTNYSSQLWYELQDRAEKLINVSDKYNEILEKMYAVRKDVITEQEEGIAATNAEIAVYEELYKSVKDTSIVYKNMGEIIKQNFAIIKNEMKAKLQDNLKSLYDSFSNFGKDFGEKMMNGIKEGVSASDFMETIKDYLKEKIITLAVYTESFNDKLAEIGAKMAQAISSGTKSDITKLAEEIEKLYSKASSAAKKASDVIESSFSKINSSATSLSERIKNASSRINQLKEKLLQQIEALQEKLQEKYNEIGEGIGSKFIDSLINGAKKEDFSKELGQYFKEQFVRLTVYTEEFQEKLALYGQRLYSAIMSGSTSSIGTLKSQIDKLYSNANKSIKTMSDYIDTLFGLGETAETTSREVSKLEKVIKDFNDDIKDLGGDVASNLISSLSSGLDVNSALINFKKFLREYIIKSYVYTESMKGEIEKIGSLIGKTLVGSISEKELSDVANAVKATYGKLADSMKTVDTLLDSVFGKEAEKEVKDTGDTITKELSKIESAMDSFKKTVSDLGGDIASNLIDGLSNGLSQSDFLTNMKNWIKKMLVQSVVYTEQMKSQIEEIGKAISSAISGGFTETSMHEIRRDLSFIFEHATSKMSGIDKILGGVFDGYATGTTSALSGLHIVGERGPELVRFNGGERVYNNADTMKMIAGAGKTNNFNVTFNNLQDTSAFAMMNQLKQYNREMAINGIL